MRNIRHFLLLFADTSNTLNYIISAVLGYTCELLIANFVTATSASARRLHRFLKRHFKGIFTLSLLNGFPIQFSNSQMAAALRYMVFVQHTICNITLQASMSIKLTSQKQKSQCCHSCVEAEVERLLLPLNRCDN